MAFAIRKSSAKGVIGIRNFDYDLAVSFLGGGAFTVAFMVISVITKIAVMIICP